MKCSNKAQLSFKMYFLSLNKRCHLIILTYIFAISTHYTILKAESMMATSVVSEELGLIYKGEASIYGITEAESNKTTIWDGIW